MAAQEQVFNTLAHWRGLESLKSLVWTNLNYERANRPLSRAGWPQSAENALAEDPVLFATAGTQNAFHVLYCHLAAPTLRLTDERAVVNRLLHEHPYALFVFSDAGQTHWHFVNVKEGRGDAREDERATVRRLLRRIAVGPEERVRTAAERLSMLDVSTISGDLFGLSPLAIQKRHDDAFDVEAVTKAFYGEYRNVFQDIQARLVRQTDDATWAHDYAQQFLSRLMFLYFIQRKRWLGDDPDFIRKFWEAYQGSGRPIDSFFADWLSVLFFEAFNRQFQAGRSDRQYLPPDLRTALQLAPYLNGGLFKRNKLDTAYSVHIPDDVFVTLFEYYDGRTPGFLERHNFTIREDSPFDQEVAVDPEMIGKVYEMLVNVAFEGVQSSEEDRRGERGIFYTPRIEIDLMCRLSLVDYLTNHVGEKHKSRLYEAVFAYEPDEKETADGQLTSENLWPALNTLLREVTVLDPACGSGSFLVGMLNVLDDLQARANACLGIQETPYQRRKRIIGQSLYGVDVMTWAVHVAELRLWLQLVVETELQREELTLTPLLPNLSFKLRPGDSLVQEIGGINFALHRTHQDIPTHLKGRLTLLRGKKARFFNGETDGLTEESLRDEEHRLFREILSEKRNALENRIKQIQHNLSATTNLLGERVTMQVDPAQAARDRQELAEKESQHRQVQQAWDALQQDPNQVPFMWDTAFAEIFEGDKQGFDIVIGNPPYVRQENIAPPGWSKDDVDEDTWRLFKRDYKEQLQQAVAAAWPRFFKYGQVSNLPLQEGRYRKLDAKSDLYIYFYLYGLSLLNPQGSFCFITSNSWLDVGYGADLQEFLLRHGHVKMIIDNQAKRSFAQADVNTIIALLAAPDDKTDWGLKQTARFVSFKVPFAEVLSPIIFEEIEEAKEITNKPEYRVIVKGQRELWHVGAGLKPAPTEPAHTTGQYEGDKWGGKYLRAPDIYFTILEKGKGKLVRLGDIAEVRRGFTTGANEFFYLEPTEAPVGIGSVGAGLKPAPTGPAPMGLMHVRNGAGWEDYLEEEFLKPVIKSPREVRGIVVRPEDLKYRLFMCHKEKHELHGTAALEYIRWGERQGYDQRPSCRGRPRWWDVGIREKASVNANYLVNEVMRFYVKADGFYASDNFQEIHYERANSWRLAVSANSSVLQLFANIVGRANFGGGLMKIQTYEVADLLLVSPQILNAEACKSALLRAEKLGLSQADRRALDEVVFDVLGLTAGEREAVYEAVVDLVRERLAKAQSV